MSKWREGRGGNLRAGSVDRGSVCRLSIGASCSGSGGLGPTHLASGDGAVSAKNGESNVLVENLLAYRAEGEVRRTSGARRGVVEGAESGA